MDMTQPTKDATTEVQPEDCRTLDLGVEGFTECPQVGPNDCQYAVPFGYAFLCCHPRLADRQPARMKPATAE